MTTAAGTQILTLTGLRFDANLGILDHEKTDPQPIQVDAELSLGVQPLAPRDPMESKVPHIAGASMYFRVLAASRLYLDNFDHIQATWFSEGKKTGQIALQYGADDFGGTLFEENVHLATGHVNKTTVAEIETLIREAGFVPAQRTTLYEILRTGEGPEALESLSDDVPLFIESLRELPAEYPATLEGEEPGEPLVMPR